VINRANWSHRALACGGPGAVKQHCRTTYGARCNMGRTGASVRPAAELSRAVHVESERRLEFKLRSQPESASGLPGSRAKFDGRPGSVFGAAQSGVYRTVPRSLIVHDLKSIRYDDADRLARQLHAIRAGYMGNVKYGT
jgi:hypothetical protein